MGQDKYSMVYLSLTYYMFSEDKPARIPCTCTRTVALGGPALASTFMSFMSDSLRGSIRGSVSAFLARPSISIPSFGPHPGYGHLRRDDCSEQPSARNRPSSAMVKARIASSTCSRLLCLNGSRSELLTILLPQARTTSVQSL